MALKDEHKAMLGIGGAAVLLLAYKRSKGGSARTKTVSVPTPVGGGVQPYTPQPVTTLDPGQSIYDPNTEGFLGPARVENLPPGQSVFDPGGSGIIDTAPPSPSPQVSTPSAPSYVVNVNMPPHQGTVKDHRPRPIRHRPRNPHAKRHRKPMSKKQREAFIKHEV